jgi:hypothetical protein
MGTNYYVKPEGASSDDQSMWIHLGKSSAGWTFSFRAYPDPDNAPPAVSWPVTDYASWLEVLDLGTIIDEYGRITHPNELLELIRSKRGGRDNMYGSDFRDADGNRFCSAEFS